MNEKQMEAELREAHQRITDLEAALVTYGRHLSHCYQEMKAEPTGCDCGYTKAISPIEMLKIESTPCNEKNYFLKQVQQGLARSVPRDPLQRWSYNANGVYCPDCGDEDYRNEVAPLRERVHLGEANRSDEFAWAMQIRFGFRGVETVDGVQEFFD
ncbi:hypothetical protein LCGC14_2409650 [marine sediment metagenome]|uniref:Uncharacterized protein n=1 Tax=marine sediment metagenome TaxID=412755 RepID=A0A0F9EMB2_9ZZZZ